MKTIDVRIQELEQEYNRNTWWKTDFIYRPLYAQNEMKGKITEIKETIETIEDLLNIIAKYPLDETRYSIRMDRLYAIREPLEALNKMIGLSDLKQNIINQILYYIQDLHTITGENGENNDYLHTVLYGNPGTGKTKVAKILADIFKRLSVLSKGTFRKATRDDFVAGYLGQTALKTKELINQTLGGVLFIDEVYSLGNKEQRDSFSKEAIDTLNEALSNYRGDWMVIIAGYEKEIDNCFFSYNPGLKSRFTWSYELKDYSTEELIDIFRNIIVQQGWQCGEMDKSWFREKREKHENFSGNGRDMEILAMKSKIAYSRIEFGKVQKNPKIEMKHIKKAFEMIQSKEKDTRVSLMYL
jgi:Holliday junction resolvasome RuvABC ATP-dependent DNA helicase subunit